MRPPLLAVARKLADAHAELALSFAEADASSAALPAAQDLLHSRFGLMFFAAPVAALRHLRRSLRRGGRLAFVCWRAPRDNAWAMAPLVAARRALAVEQPPADPLAPGPFAFADAQRLQALLAEAGYGAIDLQRVDAPVVLGDSVAEAALQCLRMGPVSRLGLGGHGNQRRLNCRTAERPNGTTAAAAGRAGPGRRGRCRYQLRTRPVSRCTNCSCG